MISLIINADDLGSNPQRDRGILEAYQEGLVTSASLLANGTSFATAVALVKAAGLPVGVHLNLAEGTALTGPIKGLTDGSGRFPGKQNLRQGLATGSYDSTVIRKELAAQIEKILAAGLQADHLDSHQHCHFFPCVTAMVIELAEEYRIPAIRNPAPAEPAANDPGGALGDELLLYRRFSAEAQATLKSSSINCPDGLWGMPSLMNLDTARLCALLEQIPDGCWELMTHPGYPFDGGQDFDGEQRYIELTALISSAAKQVVANRHIRLLRFGDLSCVS